MKIKQTYIVHGWRFEIKWHCDSITILYTISVYYILKTKSYLNTHTYTHLKKRTASPETRFFWLTKILQPVVSRCHLGWPDKNYHKDFLYHLYQYKIMKLATQFLINFFPITSVNMSKFPLHTIQIFGNKLLRRSLLLIIL